MSSTYSKILIHAVFSVKYRNALINLKWKDELNKVIGNLINETGCTEERFEWQVGFGAFSVSHFYLNKIYNYILNQEKHHKGKSFVEEHQLLHKIHNVDYIEFYNQNLI